MAELIDKSKDILSLEKEKDTVIRDIMDGNEAAATIAYKTNEICAIYPITPSSAMGELADEWSSKNIKIFSVRFRELLKCKAKPVPQELYTVH